MQRLKINTKYDPQGTVWESISAVHWVYRKSMVGTICEMCFMSEGMLDGDSGVVTMKVVIWHALMMQTDMDEAHGMI